MPRRKRIIVHPFAAQFPGQEKNPKNWPYFVDLVRYLLWPGRHQLIQIGRSGEPRLAGVEEFLSDLPLKQLREVVKEADTFVCVDSFLPHFTHVECEQKRGVVIFTQSDPNIWGHPENLNLLKDRKYLREHQYQSWGAAPFLEEAFVSPDVVLSAVKSLL